MSCLTLNVERLPVSLSMEVSRIRPELLFSASVVCGTSLGTTQVLYVQDGILLTVDGEKIIVSK